MTLLHFSLYELHSVIDEESIQIKYNKTGIL